jgi:hypothetical protein
MVALPTLSIFMLMTQGHIGGYVIWVHGGKGGRLSS